MIARLAHVARAALTPQAPSSAGAQGSAHPTVKGQEWAADAASDGRPIRVRVFMPTSAVRTSARRGRRSSQNWRWRTRRTPQTSQSTRFACVRGRQGTNVGRAEPCPAPSARRSHLRCSWSIGARRPRGTRVGCASDSAPHRRVPRAYYLLVNLIALIGDDAAAPTTQATPRQQRNP